MAKTKKQKFVEPWDWEHGGMWICIRHGCQYLQATKLPSSRGSDCYQSGGMHFYCSAEDDMACGCCCPVDLKRQHRFLKHVNKNDTFKQFSSREIYDRKDKKRNIY